MDNIRATIHTLFSRINSSDIISGLYDLKICSSELGVTEDMFCEKFATEYKCYTQDQVRELYRLLESEWEYPQVEEDISEKKKSLFYVPLHFVNEVLTKKDNIPLCKYSHLLRWRHLSYCLGEDLLTTSFLAFQDHLSGYNRQSFFWPAVIGQDNPAINFILEKGVTDLHFHLRGSSLNYELNWLCLMNNFQKQYYKFKKLNQCLSPRVSTRDTESWDTYYNATLIACAIRYYLHLILIGDRKQNTFREQLLEALHNRGTLFISRLYEELEEINTEKFLYGYKLKCKDRDACLDYAIVNREEYWPFQKPSSKLSEIILSGERRLLYGMFFRIYQGLASREEQTLFYIYLLQKNQMREAFVQLNGMEGFKNFSDYEYRKELFIDGTSPYKDLVPQLAMDIAFAGRHLKYLECRITPKDTDTELIRSISTIEAQINPYKNFYRKRDKRVMQKNPHYYILHFIKKKDDEEKYLQYNTWGFTKYRHFTLRNEIRRQGKATLEAIEKSSQMKNLIVGIDAANSELHCRPEVFGPIFRYMKHNCQSHSLGFTYHVGEDFWDITDGLRAIDEAILFLNMNGNDRLGHALALGIDVKSYYSHRNNRIVLSKQNILDNVVWLHHKARQFGIPMPTDIGLEMDSTFKAFYDEIYMDSKNPLSTKSACVDYRDMDIYYKSWLLRGDDPSCYLGAADDIMQSVREMRWITWEDKTALNTIDTEIISARKHKDAIKLYQYYHYDAGVRKRGYERYELKLSSSLIALIKQVQSALCRYVASIHLGIEANITSNKVIGSLNKYIEHPVVNLYNYGLSADYNIKQDYQISVSINTDDRGIFDTCIEREYALLALAVEKSKNEENKERYNSRAIYEWLEHIRTLGFEQRFKKE